MEFNAFKKNLICKVQLYLGNEYEVMEQKVKKNNGLVLTGIMAKKKGQNTFPTVYIDDHYREDMDKDDIEYLAMKLSNGLIKAQIPGKIDLEGFSDYKVVRDNLTIKLINAEKNKDLLMDTPYKRFHNLAIVFYYRVDESVFEKKASILVKESHLNMWDVDVDKIYEDALVSSAMINPPDIITMKELLCDLYGKDLVHEELPMYVLSNKERFNGASVILYPNVISDFAKEHDAGVFILPSSVHEVILIPDDGSVDKKQLLMTVTDVNRTQVSVEEFLSDSVYYYDREKDSIIWVC